MSKSKNSDTSKKIIEFLMDENRPFSVNDILSNLQVDCGKTAVTKTLELLVSKDEVKEKAYGKQKVYFVNQNIFGDSKNDNLQSLDTQINELSNTLNTLEKQIKSSKTVLEDLNNTPPTTVAKSELETTLKEISVLDSKLTSLEGLKCSSESIDQKITKLRKEKKAVCEEKEKVMKVYQRRKRLANNVIDAILEGYPKSKKQLLEDLDIETDDKLIKC